MVLPLKIMTFVGNTMTHRDHGLSRTDRSSSPYLSPFLVGGWAYPSENYDFVSWDDEIPYIWKNKSHVPNHQPVSFLGIHRIFGQNCDYRQGRQILT
jgi:hypothetical protein